MWWPLCLSKGGVAEPVLSKCETRWAGRVRMRKRGGEVVEKTKGVRPTLSSGGPVGEVCAQRGGPWTAKWQRTQMDGPLGGGAQWTAWHCTEQLAHGK